MESEKPIIIGAGPGGLATALQLKRYGISALLLEKDRVGGLLRNANLVENYPGFPGGIRGVDLVQLFKKQALDSGVNVINEEVLRTHIHDGKFVVQTRKRNYLSDTLVVASGTKAHALDDISISVSARDRIYYEVHPLLKIVNKHIAIIGAGDAAFDYALNLSKSNDILIFNRGERVKCLGLLWERAQSRPGIRYMSNTSIKKITSTGSDKLRLECDTTDGRGEYSVDFLIGAIGRAPQVDFLSKRIQNQSEDLVLEGRLFYVGDVTKGIYRQTAIAVGEGILAAMKIYTRNEELH